MKFKKVLAIAVLVAGYVLAGSVESAEARRRRTSGDGGAMNRFIEFDFQLVDQTPDGTPIDTCGDLESDCLFKGAIEGFTAYFDQKDISLQSIAAAPSSIQNAANNNLSQNPKDDGKKVNGPNSVLNFRAASQADGTIKYSFETGSGQSLFGEILDNLDSGNPQDNFQALYNEPFEFILETAGGDAAKVGDLSVGNQAINSLDAIFGLFEQSRTNTGPTLRFSYNDEDGVNAIGEVALQPFVFEETGEPEPQSVPEPVSTAGFMMFGLLGASSLLKKKLS